eukprot:TRINITY_DN5425_c0_g2_i1.p1 TRINITY_DN5425_c0_g2~~TRINITY_DN5425_c0_g2_i1.p1  ORF type:complete len:226 (-),score=15.66 TRINITY_DN5425_c0_g2_i1:50-640(-)
MSQWPDPSEPSDAGTCCLSWWCPCVIAGQNAEKAGVDSCSSVGLRTGIPLVLIPIIGMLANVVPNRIMASALEAQGCVYHEGLVWCADHFDESAVVRAYNQMLALTGVFGVLSLLVTAVFAWANITNRQAIAKLKGYDPSCCPACFCYFFGCHCCPLLQEWKVVNGGGAPVAGAVIGQPVAVAGQVVEPGNATVKI